jgi:uncharacterized protein VirK/YbjX
MVQEVLDAPAPSSNRLPDYLWLQARLRKAAFAFFPEKDWRAAWFRFKFLVRGLTYGSWMQPWLEFLESDSMRPIAVRYPRLNLKIQWPYLNSSYGPAKRLAIVRHHYQFALSHFSRSLISQLIEERFLYLARWTVAEMGEFSLRLSHENKFSQEGEMVLSLYHDGSERLCALLCFTISAPGEISIGCSQGGRPDTGKDEIRAKEFVIALTRNMHGSRPKNLLLFALRRIAQAWSINRLKAVSTGMHIWKAKLQSDYDAFWEEIGGTQGPDGMYDIPSSSEFKSLQEIKPKKRAMYRDRYRFLEALGQEIESALTTTDHAPVVLDVQPRKTAAAGMGEPALNDLACGESPSLPDFVSP